jgi:hypothetical protein
MQVDFTTGFKETVMPLSLPPLLPGGIPLLGHLPAFYRDHMQVLDRGYALCGPLFRLRLGPQSMVVLVV